MPLARPYDLRLLTALSPQVTTWLDLGLLNPGAGQGSPRPAALPVPIP
jgi:hypothetical protein